VLFKVWAVVAALDQGFFRPLPQQSVLLEEMPFMLTAQLLLLITVL
jgi:hypothetical protein